MLPTIRKRNPQVANNKKAMLQQILSLQKDNLEYIYMWLDSITGLLARQKDYK